MSPGISVNKIVVPFKKMYDALPDGSCTLLTATTYSATRINLAWTNGSTNEDGISIERSTDGINFAEIITVGAGTVVYANTGLTEATQYWYRVRAFRGTQYSDYSNIADDTTYVTANIVAGTVEYGSEDEIDLMFGWNIDATSIPATTAFTVPGKTVTNVSILGATLTLTVDSDFTPDVTGITVTYVVPAINRLLRDSDSVEVDAFAGEAVDNNIMDADVEAFIGLLTTPLSSDQLTKVNAQIIDMKTGLGVVNMSDTFDAWYYLGNETSESSLKNMVKNAHHAQAVNSPTHTPYEGWAGDGISSYIDSNYNGRTQGVNYTLNNASLGIYSRSDSNGLYSDIGSRSGITNYTVILSRYAGNVSHRLHNDLSSVINQAVSDSLGMNIVTRNGNTPSDLYGYKNKVTLTKDSTGTDTTNIPDGNTFICARNLIGTGAEQFSDRQYSLAFIAEHITEGMRDTIYDTFQALMTANGKEV